MALSQPCSLTHRRPTGQVPRTGSPQGWHVPVMPETAGSSGHGTNWDSRVLGEGMPQEEGGHDQMAQRGHGWPLSLTPGRTDWTSWCNSLGSVQLPSVVLSVQEIQLRRNFGVSLVKACLKATGTLHVPAPPCPVLATGCDGQDAAPGPRAGPSQGHCLTSLNCPWPRAGTEVAWGFTQGLPGKMMSLSFLLVGKHQPGPLGFSPLLGWCLGLTYSRAHN